MIRKTNKEKWLYKYQILKQMYRETGRLPKCKEIYKGVKIGIWLNIQKYKYLGGFTSSIKVEQVELLNKIDKNWYLRKKDSKPDITWQDYYEYLIEYITFTARLPEPYESYDGVDIGKWVQEQYEILHDIRKGDLTKDQRDKLIKYVF